MPSTQITTHPSQSRKRASARRTASFERPAGAGIFAELFFDSRVKLAAVCPETALMYAVLEDAFLCFHKPLEPESRFRQRAREAERWFFSDDSRRLFSFVSVCRALGLEPRYIRIKLKHWDPSHLDKAATAR
jgi:hypothetical protein